MLINDCIIDNRKSQYSFAMARLLEGSDRLCRARFLLSQQSTVGMTTIVLCTLAHGCHLDFGLMPSLLFFATAAFA